MPDYLLNFEAKNQEKETQELCEIFRSGDYDMDYEERILNQLLKKIGNVDVEEIEKLTKYMGLTGVLNKYSELGPEVLADRKLKREQLAKQAKDNAKFAQFPSAYTETRQEFKK